ncbi:hypothetical protein [Pseudonocardia sp. ICBG162]|uniref:hypothetical protein n=1 Tax=Pseudonocardia sp. ICBG162 TaxID=2846761 RepID=UPI001CF6C436|nr:hypothetical protein [Pseudonocardia sp. ICBG162]
MLEVVGAPPGLLDDAVAACRAMWSPDPAVAGAAFGRLQAIGTAAVTDGTGDGVAAGLRAGLPDLTDAQVGYLVFGLVFAGQLTTDAALGYVVAPPWTPGSPTAPPRSSTRWSSRCCGSTRPPRSRCGASPDRHRPRR